MVDASADGVLGCGAVGLRVRVRRRARSRPFRHRHRMGVLPERVATGADLLELIIGCHRLVRAPRGILDGDGPFGRRDGCRPHRLLLRGLVHRRAARGAPG